MSKLALLGLAFVIVGTLWAAGSAAPSEAKMEFYSTSAQILPVLFIVLALQVRLFRIPDLRPIVNALLKRHTDDVSPMVATFAVLAVALLTLLAAEYWALKPLATGRTKDGCPLLVCNGLAIGFVSIAYVAVFAPRSRP